MAPQVTAVTEPVWLGEGPHWSHEEQALYFVSIFDRTIHRYHPATEKHTRAKLDDMPGFIIPIEGKKEHFVVGLKRNIVEVKWGGGDGGAEVVRVVAELDQHSPGNRINDAKADPRGRLFVVGKEYFVVGLKRNIVEVRWAGGEGGAEVVRVVAELDQHSPGNRINDAKADPRGRLFVVGKKEHFAVGLKRNIVEVRWAGGEGGAEVVRVVAELDQHSPGNRINDAKADPRGRLFVEDKKEHFVVGLKRNIVEVKWGGGDGGAEVVRVVAELDQHSPGNRINDAKADPRGRLFVGTMGNEYEPGKFDLKKGSLYRMDADGTTRVVASHIDISNGLCWDVKEKAFYYADSFEYAVRRYDYDIETGDISNPKLVFVYKEHGLEGIVDGMTIDTDGNLWIANFDGHQVIKVDPRKGKLLQKVPIPALQTTSCTFGGPALDVLYVTSASMNRGQEQRPPCGSTFRVTGLGVRGHPNVNVRLQ